jgi:hypothetical protein
MLFYIFLPNYFDFDPPKTIFELIVFILAHFWGAAFFLLTFLSHFFSFWVIYYFYGPFYYQNQNYFNIQPDLAKILNDEVLEEVSSEECQFSFTWNSIIEVKKKFPLKTRETLTWSKITLSKTMYDAQKISKIITFTFLLTASKKPKACRALEVLGDKKTEWAVVIN